MNDARPTEKQKRENTARLVRMAEGDHRVNALLNGYMQASEADKEAGCLALLGLLRGTHQGNSAGEVWLVNGPPPSYYVNDASSEEPPPDEVFNEEPVPPPKKLGRKRKTRRKNNASAPPTEEPTQQDEAPETTKAKPKRRFPKSSEDEPLD